MKRGQAAFEYLILVGVLLVILMALFYYVSNYSSQNLKMEQAEDTVQTLAKVSESMYALGPGNRDFVWVNIPGSVSEIRIGDNEIMLRIFIFGDYSDFYARTNANVTGTLPTQKGRYKILVETLDSGVVQIGHAQ